MSSLNIIFPSVLWSPLWSYWRRLPLKYFLFAILSSAIRCEWPNQLNPCGFVCFIAFLCLINSSDSSSVFDSPFTVSFFRRTKCLSWHFFFKWRLWCTPLYFRLLCFVGVKLGLSHWGRNVVWGSLFFNRALFNYYIPTNCTNLLFIYKQHIKTFVLFKLLKLILHVSVTDWPSSGRYNISLNFSY